MSRVGQSESTLEELGRGGAVKSYGVFFRADETILEPDSGDGFTLSMGQRIIFMFCVFYNNFKSRLILPWLGSSAG